MFKAVQWEKAQRDVRRYLSPQRLLVGANNDRFGIETTIVHQKIMAALLVI